MPNNLMQYIDSTKSHVTRLILFNTIKTGDPIIDTFLTTFILGIFTWFVSWLYENQIDRIITNFSFDDLKSFFYKKNTIIIEGKKSSVTSCYSLMYNISSVYSDRFKAVWNHIINNIDNNNSIFTIKENLSNCQSSNIDYNRQKIEDTFMVYQNKHFIIDKNIYAKTEIEHESDKDNKERMSFRTDKIIIYIYSYKLSLYELKNYIDNITEQYLMSIKNNRSNKKFIYSLEKTEIKEEETQFDCWREDLFESYRTLNNIFFDGKQQLIDKIDFFLNNKKWYHEKGIPYTLGIGLHGPPGTGKTSFIKALANYTNRHIIMISLKMIKTKTQLEKFFFENTYNNNNEKHSISWDKKILVFEDIDCIGDIILNRQEKEKKKKNTIKEKNFKKDNDNDNVKVGDIIQTICEFNDSTSVVLPSIVLPEKESLITLDDILNLWDGIRETPGRILIISSNHYNKLDPALVRPGRIDITHELCNASHSTISDIYKHLFKNKIDEKKLLRIKEYFYSPAELINIYISYKNEQEFINRLLKNKKI
jgi:hypothetical protein